MSELTFKQRVLSEIVKYLKHRATKIWHKKTGKASFIDALPVLLFVNQFCKKVVSGKCFITG